VSHRAEKPSFERAHLGKTALIPALRSLEIAVKTRVLPLLLFAVASAPSRAEDLSLFTLTSPNGRIAMTFSLGGGRPAYGIEVDGIPLILESPLGFRLKDAPDLVAGFSVAEESRCSQDDVWEPVYGERRVRD